MRNLKKIISLALALMMVLSIMVTASAVDFTDAAEINPAYEEAVQVMAAAGILNGTGNGSFNPLGALDRASAAKLAAYLDLNSGISAIVKCETVFDDVAADHWASGYIAYCTDAGFVNGIGDGNYNPAGKITVESYAKLMLCVLGIEGTYTGDKWFVAVRNNAVKNGLVDGMEYVWNANITREQAAQMTFNAMKAGSTVTTLSTDAKYTVTVTVGTADPVTYTFDNAADAYFYAEAKKNQANTTVVVDYTPATTTTVTTGLLKNFKIEMNENGTDLYGAPATVYTVGEGKDAVNLYYPEAEDFIYTAETAAKVIAAEMKGYYVVGTTGNYNVEGDYKAEQWNNVPVTVDGIAGTMTKGGLLSEALADLTGNNAVVRIYTTDKKAIEAIVVTNTYVEAAGKVTEASKDGKTPETIKINGTDVENIGLKEGQIVTYTLCNGKVEDLAAAEYIVGTLSSYNSKDEYVINGETYTLDLAGETLVPAIQISKFGQPYAYYPGANNTIIYAGDVPGTTPSAPPATVTPDGYAMVTDAYVNVTSKATPSTDIWTGVTTYTYEVTVDVQVKAITDAGVESAYTLTVAQAEKDNKLGLAEGDYYVTILGKAVKVCDKEGKNVAYTSDTLLTALGNTLYTYTAENGALNILAAVESLSKGFSATKDGSYYTTVAGKKIVKNTLALGGAAYRDHIVLLSDETVFVLKVVDAKTKAVSYTIKVGTAALESTEIPTGTKMIVDVTTDGKDAAKNVYTAAVVFAQATEFVATKAEEAKETEDLVYISSTDYVVSGLDKDNNPVYTYTGYALDGSIVAIDSSVNTLGGIYVLKTDGTVGTEKTASYTTATVTTAAAGKFILSNGTVVTTDKDTVVVVIAEGAELVAGAKIQYVATGDVLDIVYVVEAAK